MRYAPRVRNAKADCKTSASNGCTTGEGVSASAGAETVSCVSVIFAHKAASFMNRVGNTALCAKGGNIALAVQYWSHLPSLDHMEDRLLDMRVCLAYATKAQICSAWAVLGRTWQLIPRLQCVLRDKCPHRAVC